MATISSASAITTTASLANTVTPATANPPEYSAGSAFPGDLENQPFWISFSFYSYSMPDLAKQDTYYQDVGTIRLPLPNSMVDSQHVEYTTQALGLAGAATAAAAKSAGAATVVGGIVAGSVASTILGNKNTGFGGGKNIAGLIGGAANALESKPAAAALQTAGLAVNPFLSVMFTSPSFKEHTLMWKLMPKNQSESITLNKMINTFRANMLPNDSGAIGGTLLTYPNIVQAAISVNNGTYFTYVFKPAVIKNMEVNWAASGQPSFFGSTSAPTEVQLTLNLQEIEYWLGSDFGLTSGVVGAQGIADFNNQLDKLFGSGGGQ